jgi:16S rRNA (cytidine1402-2'-O)-methyltransferase
MPGSLFVVATPIGNLEDLTFRALRTLKEVDRIAAEDTRRTSRLLAHYGISKPLVSLHAHNEHREAPRLVRRMAAGEAIALVSDAGTPAISDPGTTLVRLCREAGLRVEAIPGPSAITAALSVSGVPAVPFTFLGFPPVSGHARSQWFDSAADAAGVVVFFEAPHRIKRTLEQLLDLVKRQIIVQREITKVHEDWVKWDTGANISPETLSDRGEFVVVLGPPSDPKPSQSDDRQVLEAFDQIAAIPTLSSDQALQATAAAFDIPVPRARTIIKKTRILVKRLSDTAT